MLRLDNHETYDEFAEKMRWSELIFKSNPQETLQWVQNIITSSDKTLFKLLQSVLFHGFEAFTQYTELHENYSSFTKLHPKNKQEPEEPQAEAEPEPDSHDFETIGKDLGVYICQFLEVPDLLSFECTSHFGLELARNPSSLYQLHLVNDGGGISCLTQSGVFKPEYLSFFGKWRFANLRVLKLNASLSNMRWCQLTRLVIVSEDTWDIPKQHRLEQLECPYKAYLRLGNADIIPSTLKSLEMDLIGVQPFVMPSEQYFPFLEHLAIRTPYNPALNWRHWANGISIRNSIQVEVLEEFELWITTTRFMGFDWENCMIHLLNCARKIKFYWITLDSSYCAAPSDMIKMLAKHRDCEFVCQEINIYYPVVFRSFVIHPEDLVNLSQCKALLVLPDPNAKLPMIATIHATFEIKSGIKHDQKTSKTTHAVKNYLHQLYGSRVTTQWDSSNFLHAIIRYG